MDRFDRMLLNALQLDSGRTAESLAREIPLSPSAISRRLRRLQNSGMIAKSVGVLSSRIKKNRLRAVITCQLEDHGKLREVAEVRTALEQTGAVQWFYETAGSTDWVLFVDCANMGEFNDLIRIHIMETEVVMRHECHFVLKEFKYAPFIDMLSGGEHR